METQNKTPVEIIQELIAIHTTRKEAVEKFTNKPGAENSTAKLEAAGGQSDQFISELMNELSNFGDAVAGSVDRENEYQQAWIKTLGNIDTMNPQQDEQVFNEMEERLKKFYAEILETKTELPESLNEIIKKQSGRL